MRHHFSKKRFKNKHILNQLFFLFIVLIIAMRWLPTLSFSPSNNSSASSSSSAAAAAVDHRRKAWLFGTRPKKLHHVVDHDGRSPTRWQQDSDEDATVSLSYSPTDIRSSTSSSVGPHPLPLPDAAASLRQRDGDYRLPSPKDVPGATDTGGGGGGGFRALEDRDLADGASVADGAPPTGFRMRSVFASQDTRRNMEHSESARDTNWAGVPGRSSSGSPFASPKISPHRTSDDFVPYRYVAPKGNQFWSAPEMHTSEAGLPPPAFFDLSALGTETSPCQSSQGRSPHQQHRSSSGPPSPIHPMKALETSTARHESNGVSVHRLPLPPAAALSSPTTAAAYSHAVAKSESLPMKSQWQKGKLIGRGTFGSVYVATNRETGALCAMKEVELLQDDPKSAESIKQLEQEIKLLSNLKHSNIVQYYGSEIVEDRFYIYLEYVHPGSINKYVREHCGAITESVIRNFTRHILSGLAYLHSKKTIHRDIKGANLLVDSAGVVKLADFGMAKHLTGLEADLSLKGSPYWMAPELMQVVMQKDNSSDVAFAIDIWSLGCTIIEMFTGKPPWSEYEGAAAMFKVMRDTPSIPETLSSNGKDFLRCCFIRNPAERPTAAVLLEHRFLKSSHMPDVTSSTQIYNGTNFMDKPYSPHTLRRQPENIPDQNSISTARISKGKAAVRRGFLIPSLDILPAYQNQ